MGCLQIIVKTLFQTPLLYILFWSSLSYSQQLQISNESFVSYEVEAKNFGIIPSRIIGINQDIRGNIRVKPEVIAELTIPVVSFKSGNTTRDRNVAHILNYTKFPEITFRLVSIDDIYLEKIFNDSVGEFPAIGELNVVGIPKEFDFDVTFTWETHSRIRFKTQTYAKFTDFNINPPALGYVITIAPNQVLLKGELVINIQ